MALVVADRIQETTATTGTGTITLGGAVAGYQSFAVVGNGNTTFYCIVNSSAWEVGIGTYSTTGPTLARTTVLSNSNGNTSPIALVGASNVFVTYPSEQSVNLDASGNVSPLGTIASGVWNGTTIGVAYGGTGVTASSGANSVMLRDSNQNVAVNRLNQSNTSVTASGGTTALTAASSYSQTLNGTGGQSYTMPDATTLTTGVAFVFNNNATGTLTLKDYAAATIGTITPGGAVELVLLANGTVAGTWDVHGYLPEAVTWGTNALALGSTVITGGTWNGGTITPAYGGTGLTTFTAANNALYSTGATTLTAGTLPVVAGGTGLTTLTAGSLPYGNGTSALSSLAIGTNGYVLQSNGSAPTWVASSSVVGGAAGSNTQVQYNNSGALGASANLTFNGSTLTTTGISTSNNLTFTGTGNRITGDFSTTTIANRVAFQTSTTNGTTVITAIPNGTGTQANFNVHNNSDPTNASDFRFLINATEARLQAGNTGTGTLLPLTMYTGGSERLRIDTSGNVGIGTTSPRAPLEIARSIGGGFGTGLILNDFGSSGASEGLQIEWRSGTDKQADQCRMGQVSNATGSGSNLAFYTNPADTGTSTERMRIDSSGNVGIGTTSPSTKLQVLASGTDNTAGDSISSAAGTFTGPNYAFNTGANPTNLQVMSNSTLGADVGATIGLGGRYSTTQFAQFAIIKGAKENATSADYATYLAFGTRPNGANIQERMRITSAGYVGIGTTSPAARLQVESTGTEALRTVRIAYDGTYYANLVQLGAGGLAYRTYGGLPHIWEQAGTERMRIDASGNVGIGTSSPATYNGLLNVKGSDRAVIGYFGGTTYATRLGANSSYATVEAVDAATGVSSYQPLQIGGSLLKFDTGGSEKMRISSAGYVGIGTTAPNGALNIGTNGSATATPLALLAYNSSGLGSTTNNMVYISEFGGSSGNNVRLLFALRRTATGTDWTTSAWRIQPAVDSSFTAAASNRGYLEFGFGASGAYTGVGLSGSGNASPDVIVDTSGSLSAVGSVISGSTNGVALNATGNIEIYRSDSVPFIDFKTNAAEDYDCRIQQISDGLTFQTGGNTTAAERMRITSTGALSFGNTGTNYGTSGQVLTSGGSGAAPSWTTVSGGQYYGTAATKAIAYNSNSIAENITILANTNGLSAGPITISTGFTVTVATDAVWVIV